MRAKSVLVLFLSSTLAFCATSQQKLQQSRAKDPKYQYNLGLVYLNQSYLDPKNIDEALKCFVKALTLDTRYYLAWNAIGLAQSLKGNLAESAKAYEKCLEIHPEFTEAHNNLGAIYQEMNQLPKAEAEFQKALLDMAYPTRELPYYNLARLYVLQDRLDLAYESVQKALQIKPRLAMAHNLMGMILEKQNKMEDAVSAYERAVKLVPDDLQFSFNLGAAYLATGETAKAKEIFLKISPRVTNPAMKARLDQFLKVIGDKKSPNP
ncbi:MAG: tetratricopeptide repeat protein [Candidatus Aminicenantales bacterium]|jgi:Tfp pilus assembly protein PilF